MTLATEILLAVIVFAVCGLLLRRAARIATVAALALLLALLGYYVWPTPYRFYSANGRLAGIMGYRENRLTGSLDVLTKEGWMPMTGADTTQPMTNAAPAAHARLDSANLLTTVGRSRQRERDSVNQAKRHRAR